MLKKEKLDIKFLYGNILECPLCFHPMQYRHPRSMMDAFFCYCRNPECYCDEINFNELIEQNPKDEKKFKINPDYIEYKQIEN